MKQVAIAIDQLLNALLGGWADETLSARMWRHRGLPWWREIFNGFKIEEVQLRYSMSRNCKARGKEHTELLVANY